jgi:hypothetical protein
MPPSEPTSAAATILWWLRRPGHERQLTDSLGGLASVDRAVAYGLAASVLDAAIEHGQGVQAPRARELRAGAQGDRRGRHWTSTGPQSPKRALRPKAPTAPAR